ncbi:hypothetical protein C8J56DRAFT_1001980 [Mycena floridula]|nr:hypothetical protein C8J56DRAFT_1001980 [Mycena floridula]
MSLLFPEPPLSTSFAHLATFSFAICYVGSLYISKNARLSFSLKTTTDGQPIKSRQNSERGRDDPVTIRARLTAASAATIVCCLLLFQILWNLVGVCFHIFLPNILLKLSRMQLLGFGPSLSVYPHLITPMLFLGPLFAQALDQSLPLQTRWHFTSTFASWIGIRNYLIGPVTEEVVFRACVLAVYHLSGASKNKMIFLGPLVFGMAHLHHAWEAYNRMGRTATAAKRAIFSSLFQFAYTTIFGFHCSFLFLRTGSIYPPITAHIFCNIMGFPRLTQELAHFPRQKTAILVAYGLGIIGFFYNLASWTKPIDSIYWPKTVVPSSY